jgi:GNAT superfamily N-acetyltransferase
MLVHRRARRAGLGARLLAAAEEAALRAGRTLLVLDTADAAAARLISVPAGRWSGDPDYALWPQGGAAERPPCSTRSCAPTRG